MRHLIILISLWGFLAQGVQAQAIRMVTLRADGLETVSAEVPPSETASRRLWEIAETIRPLEAEILVLEGIPNRPFALRLAALMQPATYHVALVTTFQKNTSGRTNVGPSIAVLSKRQPFSARSAEWRATGQVELPGGFGFAGFRIGTNTLCFYVADLPGDGRDVFATGGNVLTARKREIAAQYLADHVQWMNGTLTNQTASFHVIADFSSDPRTGQAESAARVLDQAGFNTWLPAPATNPQSAPKADQQGLQPMLTAQLARNAAALRPPQIVARRTLAQPMVVYDLALGSRLRGLAMSSSSMATSSSSSQRIIWLWLGVIATVSAFTVYLIWRLRRTRSLSGIFRSGDERSAIIDLSRLSPEDVAVESFSETGSLRAEAQMWQERALNAEQRAEDVASNVRTGFFTLLRDRLVDWLSAQRRKLLASHDSGTQLMLELEDRLGKIQGQFQQQLEARDERIAELEQVVQGKEHVIRDLLRSQERLLAISRGEGPREEEGNSRP